MKRFVETGYRAEITFEQLQQRLHLEDEDTVLLMRRKFDEAMALARPKCVCRICTVTAINGSDVMIDNTTFTSAVLAKNLTGVDRVFAYVLTCGTEVDDWSQREPDNIVKYWLDTLKEMIMSDARRQFFEHISTTYDIDKLASINPGSGNADTWPIEQQTQLFALLGNVQDDIGVELTDSMLMMPTKTVSGLLFPSEHGFVNCALCLREDCPNRQVPYDPHVLDD